MGAAVGWVRADLESLDDKVNHVAAMAARAAGDVQDIRHEMKGLATKADIDRVIIHVDAFASRSVAGERAMTLHGASLTEHGI